MQRAATDRRTAVLRSALETFARNGYRTTSMDTVAKLAEISRPGLYFLFASKEELLRAAVNEMLEDDLTAIELILGDGGQQLVTRLLGAFDRWAGRYVGPTERAITDMIEDHAHLLGSVTVTAPKRFTRLVTHAVVAGLPGVDAADARAVARTLVSTSIGLKYQVADRTAYRRRMRETIRLLVDNT